MTLGHPAYSPYGKRLSTQLLPLLPSSGFIYVFQDQNHVSKSCDLIELLSYRSVVQQKMWLGNLNRVEREDD